STQLTDLGYLNDIEAIIIGEPCNLCVGYGHKGYLNYKVPARGPAAHASTPEVGNQAIYHIFFAINKISKKISRKSKKILNDFLG
ncbi:peptidase dimerization domain-containing protein, partial [Streptococcus hyovaginalis]